MKTKGLQKIYNALAKNSPTILTGISVGGLFTTVIMAVKATPKAMELMEDARYEKRDKLRKDIPFSERRNIELTKKEIIKTTWKCYLPALIVGGVTVGCIVGANSINLRRNAALASLYSLSETALKEYQNKVVEVIGENKERNIKDEIAKERIQNDPVSGKEVIITGKGETLCYDALTGRYFKSDIEEIRKAINNLGRQMLDENKITLNEVYSELGLRSTEVGDLLIYHIDDGMLEADFSSQLTEDGTPCLVLKFTEEPRYIYRD